MYFLKNVKMLTLAISMIAGMTTAHAAPDAPQKISSAGKKQKAAQNRSRSPKPNPDKPFEGEWRKCRKNDETGKPVCASHFIVQQGKQVCGIWQQIDYSSYKVYEGFFQASVEPEALAIEADVDDLARIDFACTQKEYIGEFSATVCGKDARNPRWGRHEPTGISATLYFGATTCRKRSVAHTIGGISQYTLCDSMDFNVLNKYYPLTTRKKKELMQLPWMQQCLSGQKPENINYSSY